MFTGLFVFVVGLVIGSFINAFQYRAQKGMSIKGRSLCPNCGHQLSWYDLIPLLSWVILSGRCRYCRKSISVQYPLIEVVTGLLFVAVGLKSGLIREINDYLFLGLVDINFVGLLVSKISLLFLLLVVASLIIIALHDAKTGYIISAVAYFGTLAAFLYLLFSYQGVWSLANLTFYLLPYIFSALGLAFFFFSITFFSKEKWMGAGDAEIALLMGIFLGWPKIIIALYAALFVGIIYAAIKLITKKATLKSEIPFGPFLIIGTFVSYFFADNLAVYYAKIFLGL